MYDFFSLFYFGIFYNCIFLFFSEKNVYYLYNKKFKVIKLIHLTFYTI